jgi:hypothetical protein
MGRLIMRGQIRWGGKLACWGMNGVGIRHSEGPVWGSWPHTLEAQYGLRRLAQVPNGMWDLDRCLVCREPRDGPGLRFTREYVHVVPTDSP